MSICEEAAVSALSDTQETAVRAAFDAQHARFKPHVGADDYRLRALVRALAPLATRRILDLGCGKGRFAAHLEARGARVIGLDLSAAMLARAGAFARVCGSARRLPFGSGSFDAVIAIEVLEHLGPAGVNDALGEIARVLEPGGVFAIVDKNAGALDARRPWLPSLAMKWLDERRGRWMYPPGGPARERWFWPGELGARLGRHFDDVRIERLLTPGEAEKAVFRRLAAVRLMTLWTGRARGGRLD